MGASRLEPTTFCPRSATSHQPIQTAGSTRAIMPITIATPMPFVYIAASFAATLGSSTRLGEGPTAPLTRAYGPCPGDRVDGNLGGITELREDG